VSVHVNEAISAIAQEGAALKVKVGAGGTATASEITADLVICAAGVKPNIGFLAGSGIEIGRGIRVDQHMQTSVPDIYAAGDVTEALGFHSGQPELNAIQPNAADQARVAAHNMAGDPSASQGSLAINVLDTLGLISTSFGHWQGVGDGVEQVDEASFRYLSLQFKDDRCHHDRLDRSRRCIARTDPDPRPARRLEGTTADRSDPVHVRLSRHCTEGCVNITFKLFAMLQDYLPLEARQDNKLVLDLPEGSTIQQVIERFGLPQKFCHLVLVDGSFVPPAERAVRQLKDGEALAIWPPIAGG
jgi:sulfur carrier protein ThiS